jgi:hypothetical protein
MSWTSGARRKGGVSRVTYDLVRKLIEATVRRHPDWRDLDDEILADLLPKQVQAQLGDVAAEWSLDQIAVVITETPLTP